MVKKKTVKQDDWYLFFNLSHDKKTISYLNQNPEILK